MKKFCFLMLATLALAVRAAGFPQISSGGEEYWYYLKFKQGIYVVAAQADEQVCTSAIPTGRMAQLWKVEGDAASGYTFINQLGQQLYAAATSQGSEIRAAVTPGSLNKFRITRRDANTCTISPFSNTGQSLNCWGGMGRGHDIKLYDSSDANAPMEFVGEAEGGALQPVAGLIPYPKNVAQTDGGTLDMHTLKGIVCFSDSTRLLAQRFADDLQRTAGITLPIQQVEQGTSVEVSETNPLVRLTYNATLPLEAYTLTTGLSGIDIAASSYGGFFNALQTVRQLLPAAIYGQTLQADVSWTCDALVITDEPQLPYRGFHLDVSRHFFDKDEVKKLLDVASVYKLNRFHWHLTDDQGWRIEIPEYPKLTTVGAVRKRSLTVNDPSNGAEFYDDTEYGRGMFYTLDDLREIVAYAKERNIEIIPEVDMPGHMVAAIAAYPELSCDPSRSYEVRVAKGISTEVLNVGKDEVIDFLKCVLGHVAEVFPYDLIHIGGDECPTTAWQNNADCKRRIQEEGLSGVNDLQPWLVEKIGSFLRDQYGKRVMIWDDFIANWKSSYTIEPVVMIWRGTGDPSTALSLNFQNVMVPSYPLYLDLLQQAPGNMEIDSPYFGGYGDGSVNTVERVYAFNPVGKANGKEKLIVGTQANLWTESCTSNREAEYCYFPRLLALSETAWLPASQKDFSSFYARLQRHAEILDAKDVFYAKHYIESPELTPEQALLKEAREILAASTAGAVGYPSQDAYNALEAATVALENNSSDEALIAALRAQLSAYKDAPIILPEQEKKYRIISASTYFRNRFDGSALYADGNALRIHYTQQTEPEELWKFEPQSNGTYHLVSVLAKKAVVLEARANASATFGESGTTFVIRKATRPAGGYSYIPGVVNIKNATFNLYAQMSGQVVANTDSTLCYPGTWRIVEVQDFTAEMQGLADKAQRIIENSTPGKAGEPSVEALDFLSREVVEPALSEVAAGSVTEQAYRNVLARYEEFLQMERLSALDAIDEAYYYYICNAHFTAYYASASGTTAIEPRNLASSEGFKWAFHKQSDGTVLIENKQTRTCAYVSSDAVDQRVRLGRDYKWTLREVTTDQGNTATAIVDGSGTYSWYTNPSAWNYILLKPYDWGASVWNLIKTTEEVPVGIRTMEVCSTDNAPLYDLQGRRATESVQPGVYVRDGRKILK